MAGRRGQEGALVDIDSGVLRRGRVLAQSAPGALLFLSFGPRAERLCRFAVEDGEDDPDPFIDRCRRIATAIESGEPPGGEGAGAPRALRRIKDRSLRRLAVAELLAKAGYDPDEPRDDHGRWTAGNGATAASAAGATAEAAASGLGRSAASLFGEVGPEVLAGLSELGASFAAPVAFLGTLFVPTNSGTDTSGALPNRPDIDYHYDLDTGTLTLSRDGEAFYAGHAGADGTFRDEDGRVLGHRVEGSLVLDPDALPASRAGAGAQADTDRDEPKLCPAETPESTAGRSERALAYQEQITKLPRGFDVVLPDSTGKPVRFDGCCVANFNCIRDGDMLEAKGPGYESKMKDADNWHDWFMKAEDIENQMERQNDAARAHGRIVEWHFAEKGPAELFRNFAKERRLGSTVVRITPAQHP
jgi:hypothetical protein